MSKSKLKSTQSTSYYSVEIQARLCQLQESLMANGCLMEVKGDARIMSTSLTPTELLWHDVLKSRSNSSGLFDRIEGYIAEGADVKSLKNGISLLHVFAIIGHAKGIRRLASLGADLNVKHRASSPLSMACEYGHVEAVEALLQCGADVMGHAAVKHPLFLCADSTNAKAAVSIIMEIQKSYVLREDVTHKEWAAYVNERDFFEQIPLIAALRLKKETVLRALLEVGADPHVKNKDNETPLLLALKNKDISLAKVLMRFGSDINHQSKVGMTPLMYATEQFDVEMIKRLISKGADVNAADIHGEGILHKAVKAAAGPYIDSQRAIDLFEMLIAANITMGVKNNFGQTALDWLPKKHPFVKLYAAYEAQEIQRVTEHVSQCSGSKVTRSLRI